MKIGMQITITKYVEIEVELDGTEEVGYLDHTPEELYAPAGWGWESTEVWDASTGGQVEHIKYEENSVTVYTS